MTNIKSQTPGLPDSIHEVGFKMPLPTEVEGIDAHGNRYTDKTVLSYISHSGASFWLNHPVAQGDELRLSVELPKKLATDKQLHLVIRGTVIFIETVKNEAGKHRVSLRFKNQYIIEDKK